MRLYKVVYEKGNSKLGHRKVMANDANEAEARVAKELKKEHRLYLCVKAI